MVSFLKCFKEVLFQGPPMSETVWDVVDNQRTHLFSSAWFSVSEMSWFWQNTWTDGAILGITAHSRKAYRKNKMFNSRCHGPDLSSILPFWNTFLDFHLSMSPWTSNHFTKSTNKIKFYYAVKGKMKEWRGPCTDPSWKVKMNLCSQDAAFPALCSSSQAPLHFQKLMTSAWIKSKIPNLLFPLLSTFSTDCRSALLSQPYIYINTATSIKS